MIPQQTHPSYADAVAGAVLISVGTLALIVRLGWLTISLIPEEVLRWWPLLLIVIGVGLWSVERDHRPQPHGAGEAKYVE